MIVSPFSPDTSSLSPLQHTLISVSTAFLSTQLQFWIIIELLEIYLLKYKHEHGIIASKHFTLYT